SIFTRAKEAVLTVDIRAATVQLSTVHSWFCPSPPYSSRRCPDAAVAYVTAAAY
ncbi:hypothetical protein L9F63_015622, partial [Diploptera punctata]